MAILCNLQRKVGTFGDTETAPDKRLYLKAHWSHLDGKPSTYNPAPHDSTHDAHNDARYVSYNDVVQNTNPFGGKKLYINSIDNALHAADKKWVVVTTRHLKNYGGETYPKLNPDWVSEYTLSGSGTSYTITNTPKPSSIVVYDRTTLKYETTHYTYNPSSGAITLLFTPTALHVYPGAEIVQYLDSPVSATLSSYSFFDGNYESTQSTASSDYYIKVRITPRGNLYDPFIIDVGYPYGNFYISYYYAGTPEKASDYRVYNYSYQPHGIGWKKLTSTDYVGGITSQSYVQKISDGINYGRSIIEFIIYGKAPHVGSYQTSPSQIEWQLDRPSLSRTGATVTKYGENKLFSKLFFGNQTDNKVEIDPAGIIKINGQAVYHPGNKPSISDLGITPTAIGALATDDIAAWAKAANKPGYTFNEITGMIDASQLPAIAITDRVVSTTLAAYLAIYAPNPSVMQKGDVLILTTDKQTYIHNGGSTGTASDFNLLETPTDVVTSVSGKVGAVSLVKGDVGLGNVPNVDTSNPANITQSASYRFVTDTEKTTWNNKQNALGFTPVPVGRTFAGLDLTADRTVAAVKTALGYTAGDVGAEVAFTKNTAFNKNFGNLVGTVCEGNDARLSDARTPLAHTHDDRYYTESEMNTLLNAKVPTGRTFAGLDLTADRSVAAVKTALGYTAADVGAQVADADLTAIAALTGTSGLLKKTAANTWTLDTTAYLSALPAHTHDDRYYTESEMNTLLGAKVPTSRTIAGLDLTADRSVAAVKTALGYVASEVGAEPAFSKNTAFNKNFGNLVGTVCEGNDARLSDARTPLAHTHDDRYYTETEVNNLLNAKVATSRTIAGLALSADISVASLKTALAYTAADVGAEVAFSKNTAFNKNFGNLVGTVCEGNDARLSDARTPLAHTHDDRYYTETEVNNLLNAKVPTSRTFAGLDLTADRSVAAVKTALAYTAADVSALSTAHAAAGVTTTKISNWDTAYGWGNHASAGYLVSGEAAEDGYWKNVRYRSPATNLTTVNSGTTSGSVTLTESISMGDTYMIEVNTTTGYSANPKYVIITIGRIATSGGGEVYSTGFVAGTSSGHYICTFGVIGSGTALYFLDKYKSLWSSTSVSAVTLYVGNVFKLVR